MRFLKAMVPFSLLMTCFSVKAGTIQPTIHNVDIIFHDLTDVVMVSESGQQTLGSCSEPGDCTIPLSAPSSGAVVMSVGGPEGTEGVFFPFVHLAEPNTFGTLCAPLPPNGIPQPGPCISDGLNTSFLVNGSMTSTPIGANSVQFKFNSDNDSGGLPSCSTAAMKGGCQFIENGTEQEVQTIAWFDATTGAITIDHIEIQSDFPEVPEPASLILFGSGLVMAGAFLRRHSRSV
jgi:PEP-CTERM motif